MARTFGDRLRRYVGQEPGQVSVRELARRLNPENPESARRDLNRILNGREPRADKRERIAEALSVSRADLEDDSSEEDDLAALLHEMAALSAQAVRIRRVVTHLAERRLVGA